MTDLIYGTALPSELPLDVRELSARLCDPSLTSVAELEPYVLRLSAAARPVYAILRAELKTDGSRLIFGGIETESEGLLKLTEGCSSVLLCAMTLGAEVDRLITRQTARSSAEGFIADGVASAMAEALAEYVSRVARQMYISVTGRFSPGYGDLPLRVSEQILGLVDAQRRLGIKMASGGLMIPKKSITAIIGIKDPEGV